MLLLLQFMLRALNRMYATGDVLALETSKPIRSCSVTTNL